MEGRFLILELEKLFILLLGLFWLFDDCSVIQEELLSECIERQSLINSILEDLGNKSAEPPENAFFISSSRDAASARETMLKISEELCSWKEKIDKNVSEADRLCEEGVETLTPDQFHSLKQHRSQLMTMYQTTMNRVGNLTDSLAEMEENLLDFDDEARLIEIWIGEKSRDISILKAESGDPSRVSESRRRVKSFLDEVSSYENRLKELASLSTRTRITFDRYDEQIQKMYPGCQIRVMNDHKMSETLSKIQSDYESLVHSCQDISSFISRLDSLNTVHKHNVNEATRLLNNLEECCSQCEASARTTAADVDEIQRMQVLFI
ncbi:hypothetical protein AB6A40_005855 [Gnathostoma spinigerum]|uniref:Uncharacterized protein n=1 Tax=Gnathostoma spinigerum TaxID=75299 RepID=A0ABD6EHE9_9BILA